MEIKFLRVKSKKGQLFSAYLVLLTLAMIALVVVNYLHFQGKVGVSVINPVTVLEMKDQLEIFEALEENAIVLSIEKTGLLEGNVEEDSLKSFREEFLEEMKKEPKYVKDFLFDNLTIEGSRIATELLDFDSFLEEILYPENETTVSGDLLILKRAEIGKQRPLKASLNAPEKISFPMRFHWNFSKEYEIDLRAETINGGPLVNYDFLEIFSRDS